MIVFGGSHQHGTSTDALWELNLIQQTWRKLITRDGDSKPLPRYGASMCAVGGNKALMLGGCGGPNMKFRDCWLLTIQDSGFVEWSELEIRDIENSCPPPLWCHPACKVGDSLVLLSKVNQPIDADVLQRISQRPHCKIPSHMQGGQLTSYSSSSSDDEEVRTRSNMAAASHSARTHHLRRQKQLETLERFEKKLRNHREQSQVDKPNEQMLLKQPMFVHSLDISTVHDGYVSWRVPRVNDVYGEVAEDTFFYSLTEGREELIVFGGVHPEKEVGMQRANSSIVPQTLNDAVYTISSIDL